MPGTVAPRRFTITPRTGGSPSDGIGSRLVVALGLAISVACFALFGRSPSLALAQVQLLAMGLGSGLIQAGTISLCARAGGSRSPALMNLSQAFYGVGAVLGPLMVGGVLTAGLDWQAAYRATALIAAACVAAVFLLPRAPASPPREERTARRLSLLGRGLLWTMALLGTQVSLYWAGGRLVASRLFHVLPPGRVIAGGAVLLPPLILATIVNPWPPAQYALAVSGWRSAPSSRRCWRGRAA